MPAPIHIIATADTKAEEMLWVRDALHRLGMPGLCVDVSTSGAPLPEGMEGITAREVAAWHTKGEKGVFCGERGPAIAAMSEALTRYLVHQAGRKAIGGILAMGGSGGTALLAPALQALPLGVPRVLVSTVASGNVAPYVNGTDIFMLYSVVDLQGINRISRTVLGNAAHALAGMASHPLPAADESRPAIGVTMFGVTTPCVQQLCKALPGYECLVFHATGTGGRSMERLVDEGVIHGVLDLTTTEFCDHVAGGIFSCDEGRLDAMARRRVPYIGSCGGLDMVNFGPPDSVPARYEGRRFVEHNPFITLMRTNMEENRRMARLIAGKLNACTGPVRFFIPEGGFSALDVPGQPFHDPEADHAFIRELETCLEQTGQRRLIKLPQDINDPAFARQVAASFRELMAG